jgi:LuxR family transcriptional regulator, maltose regulon positive regulatory protein
MTEDTLLSTNFHPPSERPHLVRRPRLLARLEEGLSQGRPLTLLSAPAGFGKTTLVLQWLSTLERPAAWLTLEEAHSDSLFFLRNIIETLRLAYPSCHYPSAPAKTAEPDQVPSLWMTTIVNALRKDGIQPVLVLDDYHNLQKTDAHVLTALLLESRLPGLQLVVITREDPPLPLARLRARGQLTEIRERDLRFSFAEGDAFFRQTLHLPLKPEELRILAERTEGWVTGLQLAGTAWQQSADPEVFLASFAGDDRYIVDYFLSEVLQREPEELRRFLHQTALLEKFCAALCDAATGRKDSRQWLERIDRMNLFLIRLDHRRQWFRYHGLFAGVLRHSLPAEEQSRIHHQAAQWCAANGHADLAQYHQRRGAELAPPTHPRAPAAPLSARELEILRLLASGYANAEIAARLHIALGTEKRHVQNIFGKLSVNSRTQAIALAREIELIE